SHRVILIPLGCLWRYKKSSKIRRLAASRVALAAASGAHSAGWFVCGANWRATEAVNFPIDAKIFAASFAPTLIKTSRGTGP
ncbi:MAG TPA: hypothetical protein PKH09_13425, partial [Parvularculaceae bacterium]|nr:hypothetical protein [Parvularculaceae bacterium]